MDIKKRIDALTEQEAKAALANMLHTISRISPCTESTETCPYRWTACRHHDEGAMCEDIWLDEALKEVQK